MLRVDIKRDDPGAGTVDVRDILDAIGEAALRSRWKISWDLQCGGGPAAAEVYKLADHGAWVGGSRLHGLFDRAGRTTSGSVEGFRLDETEPWIGISVTGVETFAVITDDAPAAQRLRARFPGASVVGP